MEVLKNGLFTVTLTVRVHPNLRVIKRILQKKQFIFIQILKLPIPPLQLLLWSLHIFTFAYG